MIFSPTKPTNARIYNNVENQCLDYVRGFGTITVTNIIKVRAVYKKRTFDDTKIQEFEVFLKREERSDATIEKYLRDIRYFAAFVGERDMDKQLILDYKSMLGTPYAVASANSMLAALNCFLRFCG